MHYLTWRFLYFENYGDGSKAQVCKLGPMYAAAGAWFQVSKKKNLKMEMILEMFHLQMTRSNWYGRTQWRHRRSQLYSWLSGAAFPTFQDKFIVCIIRPFVCLFYSEIVLVYGNWLDQVWRLCKRLKFFDFNRKVVLIESTNNYSRRWRCCQGNGFWAAERTRWTCWSVLCGVEKLWMDVWFFSWKTRPAERNVSISRRPKWLWQLTKFAASRWTKKNVESTFGRHVQLATR